MFRSSEPRLSRRLPLGGVCFPYRQFSWCRGNSVSPPWATPPTDRYQVSFHGAWSVGPELNYVKFAFVSPSYSVGYGGSSFDFEMILAPCRISRCASG